MLIINMHMELYDIHTHDAPSAPSDDEDSSPLPINFIQNVYPLGFEYAKDNNVCQWFSCGVHPWYSEDAEPQIKFLKEIANDPRIVAIGEAGYDKLKGPDLTIQKEVFEQQVQLSEQLQKPLIIHCVKAWDELIATHRKFQPKQPWIIHAYRGKGELTKQLLHHGFYFSIGEKYNLDSLRLIPLNRIFFETDTNESSVAEVYQQVAQDLDMSVEELAGKVEENIKNTFPILVDYTVLD